MKFEIYCDEAHPDVLTSKSPRAKFLLIGGLWLPSDLRNTLKTEIKSLREQHKTWGEIKWRKVTPNKHEFYSALVQLFINFGKKLRFRCIAVEHQHLNMALHQNDSELGFYKFYYQLLHHWILDFNEYTIFCDTKSNRDPRRLPILQQCLANANLTSSIENVQSLPSGEVVLIQLCDLLLGAASSRINKTLHPGSSKEALVLQLEKALGHKLSPTSKWEEKFNIFQIQLKGGW